MPNFNIIKSTPTNKSFRSSFVKSKFDITTENIVERFEGDIEYPEKWNIGVIVGASGTGKSTIMRELYGEQKQTKYKGKPIIEEIAPEKNTDEICEIFNKVGFSSPPSWLKPYEVLSNGEKMRVDLAKAILSEKDIIVFDEFTSVVDRNVAKIGSFATQKYIKKTNKKFVAVSCHYDILDWLEPDWVFCTDDMTFTLGKVLPNTKDHQSTLKSNNVIEVYGESLGSIII